MHFNTTIRKKKRIKAFSAFTKVKRINTKEQATKYLHLAAIQAKTEVLQNYSYYYYIYNNFYNTFYYYYYF